MNLRDTEKTKADKFFVPALALALGICAVALASLVVQIRLAGDAASGDAAETVKTVFLWGETGALMLFSLGFGALLFRIRVLSDRLSQLNNLLKPLEEKKPQALLNLQEPAAPSTKAGALFGLQETAALEESLRSLGKHFEALESFARQSAGLRELLQGEDYERDSLHAHIGDVIEKITGQFFEIENSAKQALECLADMEDRAPSEGAKDGPPEALEGAGERLGRLTDLSLSTAARIAESAGKAEALRENAGAGEEQAQEVNDLVKTISREVAGISEITAIIDQISEQTNILSMNAAIESAHAGQAGAGFAVVAGEIRKLAESTKENAGRIREELLAVGKNTQNALKASESSFENFNGITGRIEDLRKELEDISAAVRETGRLNGEINAAVNEAALANLRLRDGRAGQAARQQSFKTSLEQIRSLADTTRAEIREIQSGTGELLEKIKKSQTRIAEDLVQAEKISSFPGVSGENPATEIPAAASLAAANPAVKVTAAARPETPEDEDWSDSREVAVKQPPQIIEEPRA
jgi:methyl-accepting chemotaxis protein